MTFFISNEDTDDIIKIVESLEKLGLLTNGATEIVKHEIKEQQGGFRGAMIAPMTASVASSLINATTGKGQEGGFLLLLALPLIMKVIGKRVRRVGR